MARPAAAALATLLALACLAAAVQALTCSNVASAHLPCLLYAKTTADRQAAYNCLKATASKVSGLKPGLVSGQLWRQR